MTSWADEYLAASQVTDMAKDPDDYRVTRQSKVTIGGLLEPVNREDMNQLDSLFVEYRGAFLFHCRTGEGRWLSPILTTTMKATIKRAAYRAKEFPTFDYISVDPRDYTIFNAPHVVSQCVLGVR